MLKIDSMVYCKPFAGDIPISGFYGKRINPFTGKEELHGGIDFATPTGTPLYCVDGGKVVWSRWDPAGGGEMILIKADSDGGMALYLHLSQRLISEGSKVKTGQLIGYSGRTGNVTGPHLHFEFWRAVNPLIAGITQVAVGKPAIWSNQWKEPSFFTQKTENITKIFPVPGMGIASLAKKAGYQHYNSIEVWDRIATLNEEVDHSALSLKADQLYAVDTNPGLWESLNLKPREIQPPNKAEQEQEKINEPKENKAGEIVADSPKNNTDKNTDKEKLSPLEFVKGAERVGGLTAGIVLILGYIAQTFLASSDVQVNIPPELLPALVVLAKSFLTLSQNNPEKKRGKPS